MIELNKNVDILKAIVQELQVSQPSRTINQQRKKRKIARKQRTRSRRLKHDYLCFRLSGLY